MSRLRHKWNGAFISRSVDGGIACCELCGCVKQYVKGYATYFIDDKSTDKAPPCKGVMSPETKARLEDTSEKPGTNLFKQQP